MADPNGFHWKERRYIRGLRCKNAGISLSKPELEFLDREAGAVTAAINRRFSRTALVRYVLEKHYGDEWSTMMENAQASATSVPRTRRKNAPGVRGRPRNSMSSTTSETNGDTATPSSPEPEPQEATSH